MSIMVNATTTGYFRSIIWLQNKQVAFEVAGIGNKQNNIGLNVCIGMHQHFVRYPFIGAARVQAVGAGQVNYFSSA